jgi:hypothetical protein
VNHHVSVNNRSSSWTIVDPYVREDSLHFSTPELEVIPSQPPALKSEVEDEFEIVGSTMKSKLIPEEEIPQRARKSTTIQLPGYLIL